MLSHVPKVCSEPENIETTIIKIHTQEKYIYVPGKWKVYNTGIKLASEKLFFTILFIFHYFPLLNYLNIDSSIITHKFLTLMQTINLVYLSGRYEPPTSSQALPHQPKNV